MSFKLVNKEFCKTCDKKTSHTFVCSVKKLTVKQCVICKSIRTFKRTFAED